MTKTNWNQKLEKCEWKIKSNKPLRSVTIKHHSLSEQITITTVRRKAEKGDRNRASRPQKCWSVYQTRHPRKFESTNHHHRPRRCGGTWYILARHTDLPTEVGCCWNRSRSIYELIADYLRFAPICGVYPLSEEATPRRVRIPPDLEAWMIHN